MRDQTIYEQQRANFKRFSLLLGQFEFLQTRQEAMERVLKSASWWDRINFIFSVSGFFRVVDSVQISLLNKRRQEMEAAASKPHIQISGVQSGV